MIARRRLFLVLAATVLLGSCVLLSGRPRNALADTFFAAMLSHGTNLPVACEGVRIEDAGRSLRIDRIVFGDPPGYGTGNLAVVEDASLSFERRSFFDRRLVGIAARRAELHVTVAGDGSSSLESALQSELPLRGDGALVAIEHVDASVLDSKSGVRRWIRDAKLNYFRPGAAIHGIHAAFRTTIANTFTMLEFTGNVDADGESGKFDVRVQSLSNDDLEIAVAAHGFEVGFLSPAIMPWLGGGSVSGACDFELDLAWSRARRFAVSGSGVIRNPALRHPAIAPGSAIGESAIRLNGGLEVDFAAARVRADSLRIESEAIYAVANGEASLEDESTSASFEGVFAFGFDRAARRYGPVLSRALGAWGLAAIAGALEVRVGSPNIPAGPNSTGVFPLVATSERLILSRVDGRALHIGDAALNASLSGSRRELHVSDIRFGTAAWTLEGSLACDRPFESSRNFRLDLRGDLLTHRLVDPLVAYAGSMPLFLNGEGRLELAIRSTRPVLDGSFSYASDDTDFRFDDLRPGVSDIWNFRGKPFRVAAEFRTLHSERFDFGALEIDGRIDAARAEIVRDAFTDLELPFALRERRLTLGPFSGGYSDGRASGEIDVALEPNSTANVHARLECVDARLEHFTAYVGAIASGVLAGPFAPHRVRGDNLVSGWMEVDGRGDSMTAILRSLRGNGAIEIGAGAVQGSALLDAWLPPAPGADNARAIDSLRSGFFIENGVVASNDAVLGASARTLRLSGKTIPGDILDYAIDPEDWCGPELLARMRGRLPPRMIGIRGPISEPVLSLPDVAAWERASDPELDAAIAEFLRR